MMTKNEVTLITFITQRISPQNELTWKEPFRESFANSRQIYNLPQQSGKSSWNHGSAPKNPMRSPRANLPRNLYYGWSPQSLVYAIWWCAHLKIDVSLLLALALDSQFKVSTPKCHVSSMSKFVSLCFFHFTFQTSRRFFQQEALACFPPRGPMAQDKGASCSSIRFVEPSDFHL